MASEAPSTISFVSFCCLQSFNDVLLSLRASGDEFSGQLSAQDILDELGRFKIWAGNIGALQSGRSSLDFRLRDAPHVSTTIIQILDDLQESLQEGLSSFFWVEKISELPRFRPADEDTFVHFSTINRAGSMDFLVSRTTKVKLHARQAADED